MLSGLDGLGLGNLGGLEIFEEHEKEIKPRHEKKEATPVEYAEEDLIFDKHYTCTICDRKFVAKMVRAGRARSLGTDMDLRPRYEGIDALKYDIVACPYCGYAAMIKNFPYLTSGQKKAVRDNICASYKAKKQDPNQTVYSYEEAIERHKLALVNAIVKYGKDSEKAYICLKTGWLLRGQTETFDTSANNYLWKKYENDKAEKQFLRNAYDGFLKARSAEPFPICGMDMLTVDYLLAALALELEEYETAGQMLSGIITSRDANTRIKEKARDLRDVLKEKLGAQHSEA